MGLYMTFIMLSLVFHSELTQGSQRRLLDMGMNSTETMDMSTSSPIAFTSTSFFLSSTDATWSMEGSGSTEESGSMDETETMDDSGCTNENAAISGPIEGACQACICSDSVDECEAILTDTVKANAGVVDATVAAKIKEACPDLATCDAASISLTMAVLQDYEDGIPPTECSCDLIMCSPEDPEEGGDGDIAAQRTVVITLGCVFASLFAVLH